MQENREATIPLLASDLEQVRSSPTLDVILRSLDAVGRITEENPNYDARVDGDVTQLADASCSVDFLQSLDEDSLAQLCEAIIAVNTKIPRTKIASGPVVELSRRDIPISKSIDYVYRHILASIYPAEGPDRTLESILCRMPDTDVTKDYAPEPRLLTYLAAALYVDSADRPYSLETVFSAMGTRALENLSRSMPITEHFLGKWAAFYNFWMTLEHELLNRTDSIVQPAWRHMYIGHALEQIAELSEADQYECRERLLALQHDLEAVKGIHSLSAAAQDFVTGKLTRLALSLARLNPLAHYRKSVFDGLTNAKLHNTTQANTLFEEVAADIPNLMSVREATVEHVDPGFRGATDVTIPDTVEATVIVPDTALSNHRFPVVLYLDPGVMAEADFTLLVSADAPTYVGDVGHGVERRGSMFYTELTAGQGNYTGKVYVQILRQNQPIASMSYAVNFRRAADFETGEDRFIQMAELPAASADCYIDAKRMQNKFLVTVASRQTPTNPAPLTIEIERDPAIFITQTLSEIRLAFHEGELDLVTRSVELLGDMLADSVLSDEMKEFLGRAVNARRSLAITTNEMIIPWEIIPIDHHGVRTPLASLCALTIVPYCGPLLTSFPFQDLHASIRDTAVRFDESDDNFRADEEIISRAVQSVRFHSIKLRRDIFMDAWRANSAGLWYIATHGYFDEKTRRLALETDDDSEVEAIMLSDLCAHGRLPGAPFVFVNGCNTASDELNVFRRTSWPEKLLQLGASGYLGTRWPVTDESASVFGEAFIEEVARGTAVPTAVHRARDVTRRRAASDDLSWLAYTLYCSPVLTPVLGSAE